MSGCYRCGLPEGSESRLCETCFSLRFNRGDPIIVNQQDQPAQGFEFTPTMKRWLLSSGAAIYIAVVGLGVLVQGERIELHRNKMHADLVRYGGNDFPVDHDTELAFLAGPLGDSGID